METSITDISFKGAMCALADLLMPRVCVACGRILDQCEHNICPACLEDIPRTYYWLRTRNPMADSLNAAIGNDGDFRPYSFAAALFFYRKDSKYAGITKSLKYSHNFKVGRLFGSMLGSCLAGAGHFADVDLVVPVPLHWTRRFRRGYNQAEVIATAVAAVLGVPVSRGMLRRTHRTGTQTHLGREEKASNVRGAFAIGRMPATAPRHILLIDDVCTTGATLAQCHKVLSATLGPSVRISAATLGCVE